MPRGYKNDKLLALWCILEEPKHGGHNEVEMCAFYDLTMTSAASPIDVTS